MDAEQDGGGGSWMDVTRELLAKAAGLPEGSREIRSIEVDGRRFFRRTLSRLRGDFAADKIGVAFWLPSYALYSNKLITLARAVARDPRFQHISVLTGRFEAWQLSALEWFLQGPFVHAPDEGWLDELDFVQLMVGTEERSDRSGFRREIRRVMHPHGVYTPFGPVFHSNGAGAVYDHVLFSSLDPGILHMGDPGNFVDLLPPELVEHASPVLSLIPCGYPKLDEFFRAAQAWEGPVDRIVYHLSAWRLETPYAKANAGRILDMLLDAFPEREVVLRPMPSDLENDEVKALIEARKGRKGFRVSVAGSYIPEYVGASLLVHHRSTSADLFTMATGRPALRIVEPGAPPDHEGQGAEAGEPVEGVERLVDEIRLRLGRGPDHNAGVSRKAEMLANPGASIEYALDAFASIASGERREDWPTVNLHSPRMLALGEKDRFFRAVRRALSQGVPARFLGREAARRFPDSRYLQYASAVLLVRDGHPGACGEWRDAWLDALECCIRFGRTKPEGLWDEASDLDAMAWVERWLPEIATVVGCTCAVADDPAERARAEAALVASAALYRPPSLHDGGIWLRTLLDGRGTRMGELAREAGGLRLDSGIRHLEQGALQDGIAQFRRAAELLPGEPGAWIGMAYCASRGGDVRLLGDCLARLRAEPGCAAVVADLEGRSVGI